MRRAAACDRALFNVNHQIARLDRCLRAWGDLCSKRIHAPEQGLHPGQEFPDAEGLGEVIVGPNLQTQHSIQFR